MPQIKITALGGASGVKLEVDGHAVSELVDVKFHANVDDPIRVTTVVNVSESLSFEGKADLYVTIKAFPGYVILEEIRDGVKRYRAVLE